VKYAASSEDVDESLVSSDLDRAVGRLERASCAHGAVVRLSDGCPSTLVPTGGSEDNSTVFIGIEHSVYAGGAGRGAAATLGEAFEEEHGEHVEDEAAEASVGEDEHSATHEDVEELDVAMLGDAALEDEEEEEETEPEEEDDEEDDVDFTALGEEASNSLHEWIRTQLGWRSDQIITGREDRTRVAEVLYSAGRRIAAMEQRSVACLRSEVQKHRCSNMWDNVRLDLWTAWKCHVAMEDRDEAWDGKFGFLQPGG